MTRREYAGAAPPSELAAGIVAGALSFTLAAGGGSGYPTGAVGPFFVVLDEGTGDEEKILCSSRAGDVFTVAGSGRGADDTTDVAHTLPCTVRHIYTATDADEANAHVNTGAAVHGATGNIVGDSDAQTLTNKIISGASNTFSNIPQSAVTNLLTDQATQDSRLTATEADIDNLETSKLAIAALGANWLTALGVALGADWDDVFVKTLASLRPGYDEEITGINVSSTTFTFGSPTCGATFTAPPSGQVLVFYNADWQHNTTNTCVSTTQARAGTSTGGALHAEAGELSVQPPGDTNQPVSPVAGITRYTGLTPGNTYTAWLLHRVGGGTQIISQRRILAVPIL
jgi:hypothetical protein